MRILVMSPFHRAGGAERAAREQAEDLRALGHDVKHAVSMTRGDEPGGVLALGRPRDRWLFPLDTLPWIRDRWRFGMDRAVSRIDPHAFDVLHLHNLHGRWTSLRAIERLIRAMPTVWTLHDEWAPGRGVVYDLRRVMTASAARDAATAGGASLRLGPGHGGTRAAAWVRRLAGGVGAVVTPSRWLASWTRSSGVFGRTPVHAVRNGVRMASLEPAMIDRRDARRELGIPADARVVLLIADSLAHPHKGMHLATEAVSALPDPGSITVLAIGRDHAEVASRLRVGRVIGGVASDDRDLAVRYRAASVTVVPSLIDNAPFTALESFACGTPVVGFDNEGLRELCGGGERGWLASSGDPRALRSAIAATLADPEQARIVGARAQAWVREACDPVRCVRELIRVYESLVAGEPPRAASMSS